MVNAVMFSNVLHEFDLTSFLFCNIDSITLKNEAECECQHNTAGTHCDSCLPLYNNKPWQAAVGSETNACEGKVFRGVVVWLM